MKGHASFFLFMWYFSLLVKYAILILWATRYNESKNIHALLVQMYFFDKINDTGCNR